jgi:hypothetical protein
MPGTTAKGVPYPLGADAAATIDTTVQTLADWVDARPGVATVTTAQRNALTGAGLWQGRTVWNSSVGRLEVYDGLNWVNSVAGIGLVYHGTGTQEFTAFQTTDVTIDTEVFDIGTVGAVGSAVLTAPADGLYVLVLAGSRSAGLGQINFTTAIPTATANPELSINVANTKRLSVPLWLASGDTMSLSAVETFSATLTFDVKLYRIA